MESLEHQEAEQRHWLKEITAFNNAIKGEPPCNLDGSKGTPYEVAVYKVDDYFIAKGYTVIPPQSKSFDYSIVLGFYPPEFSWVMQASQINGMYHVLKSRGDTVQFAAGFLTAIVNGSLLAYIGYMKTNKKFYDQGLPQQFMLDLQHSMVYKDPLENRSTSYVVLGALEPAAQTAFTESQGLSAGGIPPKINIAQEGRIMLWKEVDLPQDSESQQSLQDGIEGTKQLQEKRIKAMSTSMERTPQKVTRPTPAAPSNKVGKKKVPDVVAVEEEEEKQSFQDLRTQKGPTLLNKRDNKSAAKGTSKALAQAKGKPGKSIQADRVVSSPSASSDDDDDDDDDDVEMEDCVSEDSQKKKSKGKAQQKRRGVNKAISKEYEDEQPHSEPESIVTTKSTCRRDKHCYYGKCNGKFHKGLHWTRHLKTHKVGGKPDTSMFSLCSGTGCGACNKLKVDKSTVDKKTKVRQSYYTCSVCTTSQRQDKFAQMKPLVCKPCMNKKVGRARGNKRLHTEAMSESSYNPGTKMLEVQEDDMSSYRNEQEGPAHHDTPTKRARTDGIFTTPTPFNATAATGTADAHMYIDTSTPQGRALSSISQEQSGLATLSKALQHVKASREETIFLADTILDVCCLFVHDYAEQCISTYKCTQLIDCINKLLYRVEMLPQDNMVGLIAAAFVIGQSCWQSAVSALGMTTQENRDSLVQKFSMYITTNYDVYAAKWFEQYWKYGTDNQIEICKYFKSIGQDVEPDMLTMSLVVQKSNIRDFVLFAQRSLKCITDASCMLLDHLQARPTQPTISFSDMRKLFNLLSCIKNKDMLKKQHEQLKDSAIVQWMEILEAASTTVNIADAVSIQAFLGELQAKYGPLTDLKDDITQSDDSMFGTILDSIDIKPNNKQFALAQYCVANLYQEQRQLWIVPSGQGKARIAAAIAMISLLSGQSDVIHMVFPNEHLMNRDKAEFDLLIQLSSMSDENKVKYRVGIDDFVPEKNALIIVDEVDIFLLDDPCKFKAVIAANACIGLTATTANTAMEKKVAESLEFKQYSYSFGDSLSISNAESLLIDDTIKAQSIEEKVAYVQELAKLGPLIIYCNKELTDALIADNVQPVLITKDINYQRLRALDQMVKESGLYTVIVSEDTMGMRGFDYRCNILPLTLVIAQSFDNKRDAIQAFNRVGRFGDSYKRIKFADIEIIDKKKEGAQLLKHMQFVSQLKKPDAVKLQKVVVKKATTKYKGKSVLRQAQLLGE